MRLEYISKQKRRYIGLGKEFPNSTNELEVEEKVGKVLLSQKIGTEKLWKIKRTKKINKEDE